ncbi:diaminopimelate epimerase [Pseudomonas sp. SDI]|uniref:diaminopimelate epimerase n=1 Tax=Pseudomonas sp. SDI TaxID=2170734 RepID=UPI000DE5EDD7|nr:diaminopimelate epimerase [Pseudomonas sp. SDI]PWB30454.1 diaminopimelate epimerase [Pseudomonas sp. SDI]
MHFIKYHAAGNDYLVYSGHQPFVLGSAAITRICARHHGLGADGILVPSFDTPEHSVVIYNSDGSQAEKSGNGLRILARHLWDQGLVTAEPFQVRTAGGSVTCQVLDNGARVAIDMGRATFPTTPSFSVTLDGQALELYPVSMGNPHCVLFVDQPSEALARLLGPQIEHLAQFPTRTNVQLVQVRDRSNLEVRIWERGVGYTLSSGTSSCAAASVARRLGLVDAQVMVNMPGGTIQIALSEQYDVRMQGPVCRVASMALDPECLA